MLLKKTHMPIVLSIVEGCARPTRFNVLKRTPRWNSCSCYVFVFVRNSRPRFHGHDHEDSALHLSLFQQPAIRFLGEITEV
jgi:hypothetical protein